METLLIQTANKMMTRLKKYTEEKGITLEEVRKRFKNLDTVGLNSLDKLFQDGGEGRYEHFSFYSHDYAREFTSDIHSDLYDEKKMGSRSESDERILMTR